MIEKVRRVSPTYEAIRWDGENQTEIVTWAQGGWEKAEGGGIWLKQKISGPDIEWRLVVPCDLGQQEASIGDWFVRKEGVENVEIVPSEKFAERFVSA